VAQGEPDESPSALRSRYRAGLTLVQSSETWGEFSVPGSPYFVYVEGRSGRVVGEGSAASWPQVVDLMGQARADDVERAARGKRGRDTRDERALAEAGIGSGHASLRGNEQASFRGNEQASFRGNEQASLRRTRDNET